MRRAPARERPGTPSAHRARVVGSALAVVAHVASWRLRQPRMLQVPFGVPALANRQRYANLRYRRLLAVATKTVVPGFQRLAHRFGFLKSGFA